MSGHDVKRNVVVPERRRAATIAAGEALVTRHDSERIARQWQREIDDEIRRGERATADGPWRAVSWIALWLLWLVFLALLLGQIRSLG